ncbi:hypothetical protein DFH28DRAFT_864452, partial [Melampsora americana]
MPWKHGTKAIEHIFGWMRVISPNFTVLDARQMIPKLHAVIKSLTSGHLKFEGSEHIHSGYKHAFASEQVSKHISLLSDFPSDEEITFELEAAKKYATTLAAFVGMHDNSGTDNSELCENLKSCDDVSSSIARDYDVIYKDAPGQSPEESAMQAAAHLVLEQQKADVILSSVGEEVEEEILSSTAMSIATLLNPVDKASNNQDASEGTNVCSDKDTVKVLVLNDQNGAHL